MSNVVYLLDRLENWKEAYVSPDGSLRIMASNQGRLSIKMSKHGEPVHLSLTESVIFLSSVSEQIHRTMFETK